MAAKPQNPFDFDVTKMMAELKLPAMPNAEVFLAAQRRNLETLSQANRVALEGAQAVAKRHMEIIQQTMSEMSDAVRVLSSGEAPQDQAARQIKLLKDGYSRAVANMKEIADLIQKSNGEAVEILNQRFMEAMDEVKDVTDKIAKNA